MDGGIRWESGQPGLVHSVTFRNPPPPTDLFTAPFNKTGTKRHIKVKFLNEKSESKSEEKPPILHCGQCSKNTASLVRWGGKTTLLSMMFKLTSCLLRLTQINKMK